MRRHVSALWQRTPDIYGPVFTVVMAAAAPVIGESTFLARFVYQVIACAAVGALLWVLWKRTRNPTVLAFVGLHPLVAVSVVNGGHPDALIALAFLLAVLLALERRVVLCASRARVRHRDQLQRCRRCGRTRRLGTAALDASGAGQVRGHHGRAGALPYLFLSGWLQNAASTRS